MAEKIYRAPGPFTQTKPAEVVSDYTVADQARGFNVPEDQLRPEAPVKRTVTFVFTGGVKEDVPAENVGRTASEKK